MSTRIPLPGNMIDTLMNGVNTGGAMYSRAMQPILDREHQKQADEHFKQQMALRQAALARSGANSDIQRQILEQQLLGLKHRNDPTYDLNQLQSRLSYIQNLGNKGSHDEVGGAENNPGNLMDMIMQNQEQEMPQGQGALIPQDEAQKPNNLLVGDSDSPQDMPDKLPGGIDIDEIKRALTYKAFGLKPSASGVYKEPPHIKRINDLRSKMDEAKYKHELKMAEAQTKEDLKNEATKHKTMQAARNDIPHLEETLHSLNVMKKIADDPKNSDMFGHWWLGHDKAAQRTKNPNAGSWQIHGLDPIIDAEMKMASKGNIIALKSAQANKPNFSEDRAVAQSKINSQINQIKRRIKENKRIAGEVGESNTVIVIDPSGKRFETTKENAEHLPQGWKHG